MLNEQGIRELAYLVQVDSITPMNADRLECAHIGGWQCVVGKGEFKVGDPAIYFEIDSQLPDVEPFSSMEFLKSKNFKIKSQKIRGQISQGLLVPVTAFGWEIKYGQFGWESEGYAFLGHNGDEPYAIDQQGAVYTLEGESRFLTQRLGVTYADPGDNVRKGSAPDKYKKMSQRHPNIFKKKWARWLMKREWGRKLMFFFFGKKKDKKNDWPNWVVKTDEERCQNLPNLFPGDATEWIATEKIDGTSTTFSVKGFGRKREFYICSRNVVFNNPSKEERNFYKDTDGNVYLEMAEKYNVKEVMSNTLDILHKEDNSVEFLTVQGETFGGSIQKRGYSTTNHDIRVFNVIIGYKDGTVKRLNPIEGTEFANKYLNMPYVPIVDEHFRIPETCDDLLALAGGKSQIDGEMREGLVFRTYDGVRSFKAVDNEFLLKYHG